MRKVEKKKQDFMKELNSILYYNREEFYVAKLKTEKL